MLKLSVATANTSNVTDRHRGPKRKLRAGYTAPSLQPRSFTQRHQLRHYNARYIFIVECGIARFLCAMRVLKVQASSSSPRLLLGQISFLWRPPLLSYSPRKNCVLNHSLTHPAYLMRREPKLSLRKRQRLVRKKQVQECILGFICRLSEKHL